MWFGPGTILGFDFYFAGAGPTTLTGRLFGDRYTC